MENRERSLGELLKHLFKDDKTRPLFLQSKIEMVWRKQMGPTIDRHTQDIFLKNRILYIKITSAPLKQELRFSRDRMLEFVNKAIDEENYVQQVIIL